MTSQGVSRKRPAPSASPAYPQQVQQPANMYPQDIGQQLSNDQFLQWGQSAQAPNPYQDANTYAMNANNHPPNTQQPSTQLSRRPINQVVARPRYDSAASHPWSDGNGAQPPGEGAWGDDIQELEQKAQVAKREAQAKRKQIPPFVQKLNSFLESSKTTDLIRWSDDGNSFVVLDEDEFARTLIPELFKHNNYASFVRQLNMYGFHKKVGLSDNSMRASERKNKSPSEYSNPFFRRGHPDLLWLIQKPKTAPTGKKGRKQESGQNDDDIEDYIEELTQPSVPARPRPQLMLGHGETTLNQEQLASVQKELQAIRHQQTQISRMMAALKREHEQLYGQAATFQDQHNRHENSINAILTFLATVYNRSLQGHEGMQGIQNLFAHAIPHDTTSGTVIDVADYPDMDSLNGEQTQPGKPFKRAPLLLTDGQLQGRASTMSPSSNNSPFPPRQTRRSSLRSSQTPQSGNVEELFDSAGNTPFPQPQSAAATHAPQSDIMSVIQSTNARNANSPQTQQDFSNVLSSLESAGGASPLTNSQRADMLRIMNNSASSLPNNTKSDNALINSAPPAGPPNFAHGLASTSADLDQLAKLQAEQDKSVQNLTSLLQPLSPTGSIPGIHDGASMPPPPLDIDEFLSSNHDYFHDFPTDQNCDYNGLPETNDGMNFADYQDDDELFGNLPPISGQQQQQQQQQQQANGNGSGEAYGFDGNNDQGRIESVSSSEVTTPRSVDGVVEGRQRGKGRKLSSVDDDDDDDESDSKRRRRN